MNYNELREIATSKNILIKDILSSLDVSGNGLKFMLNNETIELRKLKLLCDYLRISPALFFENGTFGATIHSGGHTQVGNGNKIIESQAKEIDYLKQQIKDKNEIIKLLKK